MAQKGGKRGRGRRGRKNKSRGRRGRRRGRVITKILISGNFTIDIINGKEQIGGPPLYSGFTISKLGGEPYVYSILGKDFTFKVPSFLKIYKIIEDERTVKFKHIFDGGQRKLVLISKPKKKIKLNIEENLFSGIIINPVCNEIDLSLIPNLPVALDIQGFIRKCVCGEEIKYTRALLPQSNSYFVFHSNIEELQNSELTINSLFKAGFKELLISYDEEGFELYTMSTRKYFKTETIGSYKTGTGDVLIASYFFYRLKGLSYEESALRARQFVENFSTSGYPELFQLM